jgi:hypothetical protein
MTFFQKSRNTAIAVLLCLVILLSSCAVADTPGNPLPELTQNTTEDLGNESSDKGVMSPLQAFKDVLLNEITFFCTFQTYNPIYKKDTYISEVTNANNATMSTPKFSMVDLAGDAVPEIVLEQGDYRGFVILRYKEDAVFGYLVNYRSMQNLKKDGSFLSSSGADDNSLGKLRFIGDYCDFDHKAYKESIGSDLSYYLHDAPITKYDFDIIWALFDELPAVDWYEYSIDAVNQWQTDNPTELKTPAPPEETTIEKQSYLDSLAHLLDPNGTLYLSNYKSYYDGWNDAMKKIYQLCLEKLSVVDSEALSVEQEQWLKNREQHGEKYPDSIRDFKLGEITKRRTYRLIDYFFGDHFYD